MITVKPLLEKVKIVRLKNASLLRICLNEIYYLLLEYEEEDLHLCKMAVRRCKGSKGCSSSEHMPWK